MSSWMLWNVLFTYDIWRAHHLLLPRDITQAGYSREDSVHDINHPYLHPAVQAPTMQISGARSSCQQGEP